MLASFGLQACAPLQPLLPPPLDLKTSSAETRALTADEPATALRSRPLPVPPLARPPLPAAVAETPQPADEVAAALNLEQVSLPTFAHVAFAEVLKKSLSIDPQVLARRDLVTFRSGQGQTAAQIETAVRLLLKSYGVAAIDVGGLVRVVPDNAALGNMPEIRRGAALPETPLPLRPIFHLVELQAVRQIDVTNWLRTLFGDRVKVQEDPSRNALLLSGTPDNLRAALEAIAVLDQPLMSGRASAALTPAYWSAEELARRLSDVLGAEGYAVHPVGQPFIAGGVRYPVVLLPVAALNSVYVFVANQSLLQHVVAMAETLDRPNERGVGKNFFAYAARNTDAELLAQTIEKLLTGARSTATTSAQGAAGGASTAATSARLSAVVVDKASNTLIIQASPDEFNQISALLHKLDRPAKAALIEVTVAEMSTDDAAQLGVEWQSSHADRGGGTLGGTGLGSGGLTYRVLNAAGGVKLALNALASNNRATILSSPRVLARNGESATIQVGQEVPIVTSVQSSPTSTATNSVLQTIQYRSTGVILKVRPVIHSGDQIDLDVAQEVSSAQSTTTGVNSSPTISTRKIDTKLTLRNGATVMLGGLISGNTAAGSAGIPFLKDIPGIGALFSNQTTSGNKTELVVLITPYVINDSHEAEAMTDAFRNLLGPWAAPVRPSMQANPTAPTQR
ncbi:MAG: secretin N-terminal domain-containing protein [Rubrivivax sp.]|nr:secretin N-terminal domain-containing protein [Rubrivivax sp.]